MFLHDNGIVKIGDFGSAKVLDDSLQQMDTLVGTPLYLAPEVIKQKYDIKADLWSLGVLLYEICTFDFPFKATSQHELLSKISNKHSINLGLIPECYSSELKSLIGSLLSYEPNKRPSVEEVLKNKLFKKVPVEESRPDVKFDTQNIKKSHDPLPNNVDKGDENELQI